MSRSLNPGLSGEVFKGEKKYQVSDEDRAAARRRSIDSAARKKKAEKLIKSGKFKDSPYTPRLDPNTLMPQIPVHGLRSLSLFSGGGGLDIGFEKAGFIHVGSYDYNSDAGKTLLHNRPNWSVFSGEDGDVTQVSWEKYRGQVDIIHGGPPCQPFSAAGLQKGREDKRDMFPEFVRAVEAIEPIAFMAENVPALLQKKFKSYVRDHIIKPLSKKYHVQQLILYAHEFGVPQHRKRIFFVGTSKKLTKPHSYTPPAPTHIDGRLDEGESLLLPLDRPQCPTFRWSIGLPDIGFDDFAPTMRSTLTGPRHTTSILSSTAAQKKWAQLKVWPNGVQRDRVRALNFPTKNGHFRLAVPDAKIIQGFPDEWEILGPAYVALGLIGNAVPPPMAYNVAKSICRAIQEL